MDTNYEKQSWVVDKDVKLEDDEVWGFDSWMVVHTANGGYTEREVSVRVLKDGGLIVRDGGYDNYVNIDPCQIYPLIDYLIDSNTKENEDE